MRLKLSGIVWAAICVGVLYLVLAVAFSVLTPAWENNDEAAHVQYIEHVVRDGTPPRISVANGIESHQPPLYYYVQAGWQDLLGISAFTPILTPPEGPAVAPTKRIFEVSHDYTPSQKRAAADVHYMRLLSILMGLVVVMSAVATGWLLTRRSSVAAAVGFTVALWPKFLVVMSAITNSALSIAISAAVIPVFVIWQRRRAWPIAAAVGALLGAGALTEETTLPIAGLVLVLLLAMCARSRDIQSAAAAVLTFGAVAGWWFVRETIVYGDPLASVRSRDYLLHDPGLVGLIRPIPRLSLPILQTAWSQAAHSTWYDGGWNQLQLPHRLDDVVWIIAGVCLLGAVASRPARRWVLAAVAIGSAVAWLSIVRATTGAQGRYLLVGIVAWACYLTIGAERLAGGRQIALWLWPVVLVVLDGYVFATWLIPYGHV